MDCDVHTRLSLTYTRSCLLIQVYYVSKASLKTADKRYSSVANDYEMTFNNDSQMWLCEEETDLPTVTFNFVPINQLDQQEPNSIIGEWLPVEWRCVSTLLSLTRGYNRRRLWL